MHNPKRFTALTGALGLAALLCAADSVPARSAAGGAAVHDQVADQRDDLAQRDISFQTIQDGYACTCVETYMHGGEASVLSCDHTAERCADIDVLVDCQEDPDGPDCDYLRRCECDCTALVETEEFEHGPFEDVVLTGIPDLWQFDFMCGDNAVSDNAVGCGPVSAAMLLYWWAQQGYGALVDNLEDWQALVRELRADYLDGGICVPVGGGQYAALMGKMTTGIQDYIEDAGYDVDVDHWKVCDDCKAGAADEIQGGEALALIKDELEAGRPVIMGFNAGKAFEVSIPVDAGETLYIGDLSNGDAVTGIINHYALITGYRRVGSLDVLTLNVGWQDETTDHLVAWSPAGKWLHLYTVDITSPPDGHPWCTIDRGVDELHSPPRAEAFSPPYVELSHLERSTPSTTNELTPVAGTSCGIAREGDTVNYFDTTHQLETCVTANDLPTEEDVDDLLYGQTTTAGTRDEVLTSGGGLPILDRELPLP